MNNKKRERGLLFVLEGPDNVGKSSTIVELNYILEHSGNFKNYNIIFERDQTSHTLVTEKLRTLLHDNYNKIDPKTAMYIQLASRIELDKRIISLLSDPKTIVILDRYFPSTLVYQGKVLGDDYIRNVMNTSDYLNIKERYEMCESIFLLDRDEPFTKNNNDSIEENFEYTEILNRYRELSKESDKYKTINVGDKSSIDISIEIYNHILDLI